MQGERRATVANAHTSETHRSMERDKEAHWATGELLQKKR